MQMLVSEGNEADNEGSLVSCVILSAVGRFPFHHMRRDRCRFSIWPLLILQLCNLVNMGSLRGGGGVNLGLSWSLELVLNHQIICVVMHNPC